MNKDFHKNKYNSRPARNAMQRYTRGVTLLELLVVISIFTIISTITVFSYGKFNSTISTQNLADDIALSIRKAQGYAIGVRSTNTLFNIGYGVHFTTANNSNKYLGNTKSFVIFTDNIAGGLTMYNQSPSSVSCTPSSTDECIELLGITGTDYIAGMSYTISGSTTASTQTGIIDMTFKRPNPEPTFCYRSDSSKISCDASSGISSIKINVANSTNQAVYKVITISNNGQISVSN